jgi:hypothetical protein
MAGGKAKRPVERARLNGASKNCVYRMLRFSIFRLSIFVRFSIFIYEKYLSIVSLYFIPRKLGNKNT